MKTQLYYIRRIDTGEYCQKVFRWKHDKKKALTFPTETVHEFLRILRNANDPVTFEPVYPTVRKGK